ncbi:6254_t:CDS:2 [Entrophospora sp. SA101]|nr:6254_t:CDS:2 [Entrophospora sp. SA101]
MLLILKCNGYRSLAKLKIKITDVYVYINVKFCVVKYLEPSSENLRSEFLKNPKICLVLRRPIIITEHLRELKLNKIITLSIFLH